MRRRRCAANGTAILPFLGILLALEMISKRCKKKLFQHGGYAFNPVLTMMAVGWVFLKPSTGSATLALLAGILTIICQAGLASFLAPIGLPTLTFPFVLVMWMFLFAAGKSKYWGNT